MYENRIYNGQAVSGLRWQTICSDIKDVFCTKPNLLAVYSSNFVYVNIDRILILTYRLAYFGKATGLKGGIILRYPVCLGVFKAPTPINKSRLRREVKFFFNNV